MLGDPRATLEALVPLVAARADAGAVGRLLEQRAAARRRAARADGAGGAAPLRRLPDRADGRRPRAASGPCRPAHRVVDEAITTGFFVRRFHHDSAPDRYFFCKGGGLGWGMPFSLGVSLGLGGEPTLCVVGDGAAMYSCQALWTAAHRHLPVVFAVVNNRQYLILKNNLRGMAGRSVTKGNFVAMDLDTPAVDFVGLARSMGVEATLVERADRHRRRGAGRGRLGAAAPARDPHRRAGVNAGRIGPARCARRCASGASGWCGTGAPSSTAIDWEVRDGERWVVLGPNGSGKTTLVRIASLYLHPTEGEVEVLGGVLGRVDVRRHRRRVALASMALSDQLRPTLTATEIVMCARNGALEPWWHTYDDDGPGRGPGAARPPRRRATWPSGRSARAPPASASASCWPAPCRPSPACCCSTSPPRASTSAAARSWSGRSTPLAGDPTSPPAVLVTHHLEEIPPRFTHALLLRDGRISSAGPIDEVLGADALSACFGLPLEVARLGGRWQALGRRRRAGGRQPDARRHSTGALPTCHDGADAPP